jgi:hypothetical protein
MGILPGNSFNGYPSIIHFLGKVMQWFALRIMASRHEDNGDKAAVTIL